MATAFMPNKNKTVSTAWDAVKAEVCLGFGGVICAAGGAVALIYETPIANYMDPVILAQGTITSIAAAAGIVGLLEIRRKLRLIQSPIPK